MWGYIVYRDYVSWHMKVWHDQIQQPWTWTRSLTHSRYLCVFSGSHPFRRRIGCGVKAALLRVLWCCVSSWEERPHWWTGWGFRISLWAHTLVPASPLPRPLSLTPSPLSPSQTVTVQGKADFRSELDKLRYLISTGERSFQQTWPAKDSSRDTNTVKAVTCKGL